VSEVQPLSLLLVWLRLQTLALPLVRALLLVSPYVPTILGPGFVF